MLEYAFACFETKVQPVECTVMLLQDIHYPQRLQVVFESPVLPHAIVQCVLTGVAKRRVPQVMCQGDGLDQIFIQPQVTRNRAAYLRHLQTMCQPRPEQVTFMIDENLGFILEPSECRRMNDSVAVSLKG